MKTQTHFDVIIIGRSYSGLAAGLALGRALRKVLIIDNGKPCNAQTPHSHNFLTRDGETPAAIAAQGRKQLEQYSSVSFLNRTVIKAVRTDKDFEVEVSSGEVFGAAKLLFATGICDLLLNVDGLADCWGISVLHCPFCHGYEVRNQKTGIIGNGNDAYELVSLIANWTGKLTVFTNGPATLSPEQTAKLHAHHIGIVEKQIIRLQHHNGHLHHIQFVDGSEVALSAAYIRSPFRQACPLPELLGCALNDEGYIQVDSAQATSIAGVFACGDNTTKIRTITNAVSSGDIEIVNFEPSSFDAIALIHAHFAASRKAAIHQQLHSWLKPDGMIILEAFRKAHLEFNKANPNVGEPRELGMLYSREDFLQVSRR